MNKNISLLRNFLETEKADAILVNSADKFLSEYNVLPLNSRYKVTNFSGSMGECIVTKDKVYQIADGRYYEQADIEVNHDIVTVLKIVQGGSQSDEIIKVLHENSVLLISANKVSAEFCQILEKKCKNKNISVKYLNHDILDEKGQTDYTNVSLTSVDTKITKLSPEEKFRLFSSKLKENQILLITVPVDFAYITNLRNYDFPFSSAPRAKAIITQNSEILYTNSKIPFKFEGLKVKKLSDFSTDLTKYKNKTIFADKSAVSQRDFMSIDCSNKLVNSNLLNKKSHKYKSEIQHLKYSFAKTDMVLKKVDEYIQKHDNFSEYDLLCELNTYFEEEGAVSQSFKPIIASGVNSSVIHYSKASKTKIIKEGDFIMVDCGGYFEGGLATDITRTFIKGKPNTEQKRIYTKVFQAFVSTYMKNYSSKAVWADIDRNTRKKLKQEEKNGWYFSHSTGHGIGISVHEFPPRCADMGYCQKHFKKNYVFSIEPGLYKQNTGGVRLENAVYVKSLKDGKLIIEVLSHYPFEEKLINKTMLTAKETKFLEEWQNYAQKNIFND